LYSYILCIGICAVIWTVNGIWLRQAVRKRITSEIYIHTGLGIFFTVPTLELTLSTFKLWPQLDIFWVQVIGLVLYIPSAYLVAASMHALKHKGRSKTADPTATTTFIDTGVYGIVRQPMTLGVAIWCIAFMLAFQSILAVVIGTVSLFCFWISAKKEAEYNIKKFGDEYKEYMKKVPMWNFFKGLRK